MIFEPIWYSKLVRENQKGIVDIVFVIIIVVLIGLVAFFAFQNKKPVEKVAETQQETMIPIPNTGWNNYSGPLFTFNYPPEWQTTDVIKANPKDVILEHDLLSQGFSVNVNLPGFGYDCLDKSEQEETINFNDQVITVNIQKGSDSEECGNIENRRVVFSQKYNGDQYMFFFGYKAVDEEQALETLQQVLSTFEFVE